MIVHHVCPHCGRELKVYYDAQNGYNFDHIETA